MKQGHFILATSIATALAGASAFAQPISAANLTSLVGNGEASRVTQTVNNNVVSSVQKTHLKFVEKNVPIVQLNASSKMNHLQLVLKPSVSRQAALTSLIADQHDPKSSRFQQWLTPKQFGDNYGLTDGDIASITAWLKAQGFVVNKVYPNKTLIDFSGTVGQISSAFHTQENIYEVGSNKEKHIANSGDISIPVALKNVVAGVMGLNDFHAKALRPNLKSAKWDAGKKGLVLKQPKTGSASLGSKSQAINIGYGGYNPQGVIRALVPNDMSTMYGIRTIRANGITGKGVTIAVVEDNDMIPADWTNFVNTFNLAQFGGTFTQMQPQPDATDAGNDVNNCQDPNVVNDTTGDDGETLLDSEWSTAIAPSANIVVATCADYYVDANGNYNQATDNSFGGVFVAANNLVNAAAGRPDIISASYGYGEYFTDSASKSGIDAMWSQADAEGISVFVSSGDSGSNPSFNGQIISGYLGNTAVDANAFATSPNVTAVGGTDLADILDGTTSKYFASAPSVVGGSALSYVPEIPWNESCGNGVAATSLGYTSAVGFCKDSVLAASGGVPSNPEVATYYDGIYSTSEGGSGGPSSVDRKPAWQRQIYGAAADQSRDLPDVALFAGSFGDNTFVAVCSSYYVCSPDFTTAPTPSAPDPSGVGLSGGTSLASPMFAGIQALIDQGLHVRGVTLDQGNAAPTLYALAAGEYGAANTPNSSSLTACNANNGATGTNNCVFHNVARGSISTACYSETASGGRFRSFTTPNCYYYDSFVIQTDESGNTLTANFGLTTVDANPTSYGPANKAFPAQPGWSFASGLGSVNATNLLIAWRAFVNAPPASVSTSR